MSDFPIFGDSGIKAALVTIPVGAAGVSEMIPTGGKALVGIVMPSSWTAADIGYKTCLSGNINNLMTVYSAGGDPMTTTVAASRHIVFPTADAIFVPFLQIASVAAGTATPEPQLAPRDIILLFRPLFS